MVSLLIEIPFASNTSATTDAQASESPRYTQMSSHSLFETHVDAVPMLVICRKEAVGARVGAGVGTEEGAEMGKSVGTGVGTRVGTGAGIGVGMTSYNMNMSSVPSSWRLPPPRPGRS